MSCKLILTKLRVGGSNQSKMNASCDFQDKVVFLFNFKPSMISRPGVRTRMAITAKTDVMIMTTLCCLLDPRSSVKFITNSRDKMTTTTIKSAFVSATMSLG